MEKENQSCVYNGASYSQGATICSNGFELVCNNGNWEPTGKICEANDRQSRVIIISESSIEKEMFSGCENGWNLSDAYTIVHPPQPTESAVPKLKITQNRIKITYSREGGGKISQTLLYGTGGSFYLGEGEHIIPPGEYTHQIAVGVVINSGAIHSYVCYK